MMDRRKQENSRLLLIFSRVDFFAQLPFRAKLKNQRMDLTVRINNKNVQFYEKKLFFINNN